MKKLFNERRKKHLGAVKNIKNVESYEQRYKMISLIIDEMVRIIESKKAIIERFNDELKKNSTTSLSDGTIKDGIIPIIYYINYKIFIIFFHFLFLDYI